VQHDALGGESRVQRNVQLAAGRDVEVEPFLGDELRHGGAEKRLARVRDAGPEGVAVGPATGPELVFVVHVERGAELGGQPGQVDAADGEAAVVAYLR